MLHHSSTVPLIQKEKQQLVKTPRAVLFQQWLHTASELERAGVTTHRVTAVLMDDDPVRKRLVVRLDVQSAFSRIQGVFLDKINIIDSCNL